MPLAEDLNTLLHGDLGVRVTAYDGSSAGRPDADVWVDLRSPRALAHLVRAPGSLGLARAFIDGDIEVHGDLYTGLSRVAGATRDGLSPAERLRLLRLVAPGLLRRAGRPTQEVHLRGRRHSRRRDAASIAHHYDVSNRFYHWVLGPSMAYTCAVYPRPDATLEEAQEEKFDLVCRKLGLRPGMRLLDVGCGWGGMVLHAAQHYGVRAIGVTLSRQQADWGAKAVADAGLSNVAEVRHGDYRDVSESSFDAISSIGLTEHIGRRELPGYFDLLHAKLRPGGRLLNHCIMRPVTTDSPMKRRGFINRYVFPDGELLGLGHIVTVMQNHGFEIRHEENLREHYARTLTAWCANLHAHWDEAVAEVGAATARVWALYMAGSRLGFELNQIQLHQVLGVKVHPDGRAEFPLRPDWERAMAALH